MDARKLKRILEVLIEVGGGSSICAEHDVLYLHPPGEIAPDSPEGEKLKAAGARYNEEMGWYVNT